MNRWTSILGALMLVLLLWTGGAAHAAEQFNCIPATAEAAHHFDGDQDQVPSSPEHGVAHHHSGCGGHYAAAPADLSPVGIGHSRGEVLLTAGQRFVAGQGPKAQLRPPIA